MAVIHRRDFLKAMGIAGASATVGCSADSARKLIPYVIPPVDIVPGEATWYATTCRECPAGCGMLAKNRDGRIIKVEGNPEHPINRGALCARGQASLQGLYNPDRFTSPQRREEGRLVSVSWQAAKRMVADRLAILRREERGERIVFLSGLQNGSFDALVRQWLATFGGGQYLCHESFAYEPLRAANRLVYDEDGLAALRLDQADLLLSLDANFLETWISNVEYARQFARFHEPKGERKNLFIHVGPRRSMTAANADQMLLVAPGDEWFLAMGLLEQLLAEADQGRLPLEPALAVALKNALGTVAWSRVAESRGIPAATLSALVRLFLQADRPLVIAAGLPQSGPHATATAVAANLLCLIKPGSRELIDFAAPASLGQTDTAATMLELVERIGQGEIDLLFIHEANPLFTLPASWKLWENLAKVNMVVSLAAGPDETAAAADIVLPTHTPLESWGDYAPRPGIVGLLQPVMGTLFDSRHPGDLLLELGREAGAERQLPWTGFFPFLQARWRERWHQSGSLLPFEAYWQQAVQRGGGWDLAGTPPRRPRLAARFAFTFPAPASGAGAVTNYHVLAYPTVQFFDGRMANRPWLQELPDPVTQTTWGGWLEMHPQTAAGLGAAQGDILRLTTAHGAIEAPVLPLTTVVPGVVALPIGQGHTAFGRFADGLPADGQGGPSAGRARDGGSPANPLLLFAPGVDPISGAMAALTGAEITRTGRHQALAHTDGSLTDHGRELVETELFTSYLRAAALGRPAAIDLPLPSGLDPRKDFYPAHPHRDYRWCMVVDLDRCIGCGACVVACYAENNVAIVGRDQVLKGREMSWLRIQRYFSEDGTTIRYLPMLCQHCDAAPCESVCPVFAPHHSVDGLNNQIYNRCFGTRFCSQNDPYKVRRFNWFTFTRPTPLDWQLNPDVTVRQKGVMEKCSFCIQRIVAAKNAARDEGRKVRDGDFTTACAQTCPTDALIFGNLLDDQSRVARLVQDARAYQVLRELNTKPAVIYLKKLVQEG